MDGQVCFQVRMVYDRRSCLALQRAAGKTTRKRAVRCERALYGVLALVLLLCGALLLWVEDYGFIAWAGLSLGAVSLALCVGYYPVAAWRSRRNIPQGERDAERVVTFTETQVVIRMTHSEARYEYASFTALCLWEEYLALFVDKKHALVVDERGLVLGDAAGLEKFLSEKTGLPIQTVR